ncbi:MAG: threonine/serine exporter family protein [Firmicutes bacterium]|nr:threonine/serine exporter family protein [Bacillota bacterium]
MNLLFEFITAMVATMGFSLLFNVGKRDLPVCGLIGAIAWVIYKASMIYYASPILGCLFAAASVGITSFIASRVMKNASTVYIIPGIVPMVPGINVFNTMMAIQDGDMAKAADLGIEMLCMAGAIAIGLLIVESFTVFVKTSVLNKIKVKKRI